MLNYNPANWFWIIGGSTTQVFSSKTLSYVSVSDTTYAAWLAAGNTPTKIDTDADLQATLFQAGVRGLVLTSTGTPAVNGTYPTDPTTQADVAGVTDYILLNNTFPNGASTFAWLDMAGTPHVFPNITVFKAFATAFANYVSAMTLFIDGGLQGSAPSSTVTIS